MTSDQLWGALFLTISAYFIWKLAGSLSFGKSTSWLAGGRNEGPTRVPNLSFDRRSSPFAYWLLVLLDLIVVITLGWVGILNLLR